MWPTSNDGHALCHSLTQEASLKDVDHIRQQIYRIKGGEQVTAVAFCTP